jgi:hypothetical protein
MVSSCCLFAEERRILPCHPAVCLQKKVIFYGVILLFVCRRKVIYKLKINENTMMRNINFLQRVMAVCFGFLCCVDW